MWNLVGGQAHELYRNVERIGEGRGRCPKSDGIHHGLGKALAQQPINSGAGKRQQRNDPEMKAHSLRRFTRSTFRVSRVRNTEIMIARPTAASAAATTMTKNTNTCPLSIFNSAAKATNVRFTALSISSIDMKIVMMLRLIRNPVTPQANRIPLRMR